MSWYFFGGFSAYLMLPSGRQSNHSGWDLIQGWSGEHWMAKSSAISSPSARAAATSRAIARAVGARTDARHRIGDIGGQQRLRELRGIGFGVELAKPAFDQALVRFRGGAERGFDECQALDQLERDVLLRRLLLDDILPP